MSLIRTEGLTKIYRTGSVEVLALNEVSLEVPRGQFLSIMGPSGSGKSTFLNLLGCLDKPTRGKYYLEGKDVSRLTDNQLADIRNRKVGFVFQNFNLLRRTNALENVLLPTLYGGRNHRVNPRQKAMEVLEWVGLGARWNHLPTEMSGGEQQRVAIARALVRDPMLILADEPTGNLDTLTGEEIMLILQRLNRERGITIILVTHEEDLARHTQRILRFRDGRLVGDEPVPHPLIAEEELAKLQEQAKLRENVATP